MKTIASDPDASGAAARPALWIRAFARLPFWLLYGIAGALALLLRYGLRYRVRIARANLQRCFPERSAREIDRLLRQHYGQLMQVALEFLKLASLSAEELRRRVRVLHVERAHAEIAAGRSVLLLAAHQCNWEWALQAVTLSMGVPIDAAYKPLHSLSADRQLRLLRARFGARLIAAKRLLREFVRRRHEPRALALLADQIPMSSSGRHWLSFLGQPTAFYPGPADIARSAGLAAFFISMRRLRRGFYEIDYQPICGAHEQLDPPAFTARYARLVEEQVRAHPADWMWTHRRWKLAPPAAAPLGQALQP